MRNRVPLAAGLAVLLAAALVWVPTPAAAAPLTKVLVFSKTAGFRHTSIPNGIAAIQQLGAANGFTVTATEDANQFTTANLAQYQAVMGVNPSHFCATGDGKDRVKGMNTNDFPVERVSWGDATAFCKKLSARPEEKNKGRRYYPGM